MPNSVQLIVLLTTVAVVPAAYPADLPASTSEEFCQRVQQLMTGTELLSTNTVFDNMPDYRSSKPSIKPLTSYQLVSLAGSLPVMVSCKVKGAAHIRAFYGDDSVSRQEYCPSITRRVKQQAVSELRAGGQLAAAERAEQIVVDETDWGYTGRNYLADFELSYVGDDGAIHLSSPGLFHDYDSWMTWILPERLEGQVYCHIASKEYVKALATGEMKAGLTMTTADDAPATPR